MTESNIFKIRVAGIEQESIVDGPGLRLAVFTQGCFHNCPGCHNPHTHSRDGGSIMSIDEILELAEDNPLLSGITISGGEPFEQARSCAFLAAKAKARGLSVYVFSGYTFEELLNKEGARGLLEHTDVLIDGRFVNELRSVELRFRGSSNQRAIDCKKSLSAGHAVEIEL